MGQSLLDKRNPHIKLLILKCALPVYLENEEVSQPSPAPEHPGHHGSPPPKRPAGQTDTELTLL